MKLNISKSILGLSACLMLTTFISSCSKKEDAPATSVTPVTTVAEDKKNIDATVDLVANDAVDILKTEGVKAVSSLTTFMGKSPAFGKQASLSGQIGAKVRTAIYGVANVFLKSKKSRKTTSSGYLDFAGSVGTYTWNIAKKDWDQTKGTPSDKVILKFPSDTNSLVNNAIITISKYTEFQIQDSTLMPNVLIANLTIDGNEFAHVDYAGTFNGEGTPVAINLNLFVKPYTLDLKMNNQQTIVTGNLSLKKEGEPANIIGLSGTVAFMDATQDKFKTIDAELTLKDLNLKGSANIEAIEKAPNGKDDATVLNANVKLAISYAGSKVGDLKFISTMDSSSIAQTQPVILFAKDNSTKPAQDYFETLSKKVSDQFKELGYGKK